MKFVVQPETVVANGVAPANTSEAPVHPDDAPLLKFRSELDRYYAEILSYQGMEPDQVMISVSGISARLTGIRAQLCRSPSQRANRLRTSEVDPLLEQLDLQFRIHSRLLAMRQFDFEVTRGAPS
jgi:hypothetical protein